MRQSEHVHTRTPTNTCIQARAVPHMLACSLSLSLRHKIATHLHLSTQQAQDRTDLFVFPPSSLPPCLPLPLSRVVCRLHYGTGGPSLRHRLQYDAGGGGRISKGSTLPPQHEPPRFERLTTLRGISFSRLSANVWGSILKDTPF